MTHLVCQALLQVLFILYVGLIAVIFVGQACYLAIVDVECRKDLLEFVFGKQER